MILRNPGYVNRGGDRRHDGSITLSCPTKTSCLPISVTDLRFVAGVGSSNCERCGRQDLRFLHLIERPDGKQMIVGRECAQRLCWGYNPERQEGKLRSLYARRSRLLTRNWGTSWRGNPTLTFSHNRQRVRVTIFPDKFNPDYFRFMTVVGADDPYFSTSSYATQDCAKIAAFEKLATDYEWGTLSCQA